jgi:hypothetical protein
MRTIINRNRPEHEKERNTGGCYNADQTPDNTIARKMLENKMDWATGRQQSDVSHQRNTKAGQGK